VIDKEKKIFDIAIKNTSKILLPFLFAHCQKDSSDDKQLHNNVLIVGRAYA